MSDSCRYVNFTAIQADAKQGTDATAAVIPAGAIAQTVNGESSANQCSYGETDRAAKRGGPWIATVADFPQSSLYVSNCPPPHAVSETSGCLDHCCRTSLYVRNRHQPHAIPGSAGRLHI